MFVLGETVFRSDLKIVYEYYDDYEICYKNRRNGDYIFVTKTSGIAYKFAPDGRMQIINIEEDQ